MTKYKCPKCGTVQIKQFTNNLLMKVQCYKCDHIELLTNILGQK